MPLPLVFPFPYLTHPHYCLVETYREQACHVNLPSLLVPGDPSCLLLPYLVVVTFCWNPTWWVIALLTPRQVLFIMTLLLIIVPFPNLIWVRALFTCSAPIYYYC